MVKKNIEKRRYKIIGFRDLMDGTVRVLLNSAEPIKIQRKQPGLNEMVQNPFSVAQQLMQQAVPIYYTFLISQQDYLNNIYKIGEIVIVTIEKEG